MSHYDNLDALILERLAVEPLPFADLSHGVAIWEEVSDLAEALGGDPIRILDGRLQALRKAGRIKSERQRWHLIKPTN